MVVMGGGWGWGLRRRHAPSAAARAACAGIPQAPKPALSWPPALAPLQAFLMRKLKISGSMGLALKLQPILDAAAPTAKL